MPDFMREFKDSFAEARRQAKLNSDILKPHQSPPVIMPISFYRYAVDMIESVKFPTFLGALIVTEGDTGVCRMCRRVRPAIYLEGLDIWILPGECNDCTENYYAEIEERRLLERVSRIQQREAATQTDRKRSERKAKV